MCLVATKLWSDLKFMSKLTTRQTKQDARVYYKTNTKQQTTLLFSSIFSSTTCITQTPSSRFVFQHEVKEGEKQTLKFEFRPPPPPFFFFLLLLLLLLLIEEDFLLNKSCPRNLIEDLKKIIECNFSIQNTSLYIYIYIYIYICIYIYIYIYVFYEGNIGKC